MPRKKKEIQAMIKQAKEQGLTKLDLTNCQLSEEFIDNVCEINQLQELNLTHCHLTKLPDKIANLSNLTIFILKENQLETLPESICKLEKIEHLDLTLSGLKYVSENLRQWLKGIATAITEHTDIELKEPEEIKPFIIAEPNILLLSLQSALDGYANANSADDHHADGDQIRQESDKQINEIFEGIPELKEVLSDFYKDFMEKNFYYFNQESEKVLKQNPFKLPTQQDIKWLAEKHNLKDTSSYYLSPKTTESTQRLCFIKDDQEKLITILSYGDAIISNQPYAADESYFADFTAKLYRAGQERFYIELIESGFSEVVNWYISEDFGKTWSKSPLFLHKFFNSEQVNWILLSSI